MNKEIIKALKDYNYNYMEKHNKGMLSMYKVNHASTMVLYDEKITFSNDRTIVLKDGKPYAKIIYRYGKNGKMLIPKIIAL